MLLGAVTYNILKDWDLETIIKNLEAAGFEVVATNGEQFTSFLKNEIERWKDVIQKGNITAE